MDIPFYNVLKLGLILVSLHVSRQAVPASEPSCTKDKLPTFDHTAVKFAQWPASDECQTSYEIECEPGYEMTLHRTCPKDGTTCDEPRIDCTIISCPLPYSVLNATYTLESNTTTYGSRAIYTCDDGLYMTLGSPIKTCEADKQWTFDDPYCSLDRPTTTADYNATTTPDITTTTAPPANFTGYKPVISRPDRPSPFEAENASIIGSSVFVLFTSPLILIIVIDLIQIGGQLKVKFTKGKKKDIPV